MSEDISVILRPLRKVILTGNTLEPIRTGFVLTNLNRCMTFEKEISTFRKYTRKKKENNNGQPTPQEAALQRKFNNLSIVPGVQYPKTAIRLWEESVPDLIKMVDEGKGQEVLDTLISATKLKNVCRKTVVLCLVIILKKAKDEKLISSCFSAVPQISSNSQLFMLFVEIWKLYSAKDKSSGWGKRMKKMVRNWYLQWDPKLLALEVSRYPSAYTWSHKDILRMAHINLRDLPTGTKIVLHYIFSGFKSTKEKYNSEENSAEILDILQILDKPATNCKEPNDVIERGNKILDKFGSISVRDFPSQSLCDTKVLCFVLEKGTPDLIIDVLGLSKNVFKLISDDSDLRNKFIEKFKDENFIKGVDLISTLKTYNTCRRISSDILKEGTLEASRPKIWMKNVSPSSCKTSKIRLPVPRPKEMEDFFIALDSVISAGAKNLKVLDTSCLIFINIDPSIDSFISISLDDPISKEIRATQAIAFLVLAFSNANIDALSPALVPKVARMESADVPFPLYSVHSSLGRWAKQQKQCLDIDASLGVALDKSSPVCIFVYFEVSSQLLDSIYKKFIEIKKKDQAKRLKLIVIELKLTLGSPLVSSLTHPDLIYLFGFNRALLPTIDAFLHESI